MILFTFYNWGITQFTWLTLGILILCSLAICEYHICGMLHFGCSNFSFQALSYFTELDTWESYFVRTQISLVWAQGYVCRYWTLTRDIWNMVADNYTRIQMFLVFVSMDLIMNLVTMKKNVFEIVFLPMPLFLRYQKLKFPGKDDWWGSQVAHIARIKVLCCNALHFYFP